VGQSLLGEGEHNEFGYSVALSEDGKVRLSCRSIVSRMCYLNNPQRTNISSVFFFDQTLAVGAIWHNDGGTRSGHVRVYRLDDERWAQLWDTLVGEKLGDWLGNSVLLQRDGGVVAIGAICRNNGWQGYVKVYEWLLSCPWPSLSY
jgi:hypothetical protein